MNLDYLRPGATIPITAEAIRYLVDVAKELEAENNFLKDWRDTWAPYVNQLKQTNPLSDEEIDEVLYSMDWAHDPVEFARAILKKASEK